ncbi:MAG: hypothetical protein HKN05_00200 [Rhizobiales bacterium]|nr:hypothetical protein [Hyphomicrobiales bacterium]
MNELHLRLSSFELTEWMAFYTLEPWGYEIDNFRPAVVAATIANVNREKGKPAYSPKDFMPAETSEQTASEQIAIMKGFQSG